MLIYTTDQDPGILRKGAGRGFYYVDADGIKVEDPVTLERIQQLAIPPAYKDVWICPLDNGHLQATGRDERMRKQYRYHDDWQQMRNLSKFARLLELGHKLPALRRRLRRELRNFEGRKSQVVASAVRIIDKLGLRVGNERYLEANQTRGVSTLSPRNVDIDRHTLDIEYTAKGGQTVSAQLNDPLVARALARCHELPGQRLFRCLDENGDRQPIDSSDINDFLAETCGPNITAKDLRTWRASAETVDQLRKIRKPEDREAEIREAIRHTAGEIGNRYATCRKHYVHPKIIKAYEESSSAGFSRLKIERRPELLKSESLLMRILD